MNYTEQQKEEIVTIVPRTINLNLSDADVKRLYIKAAGTSLTHEELIEKFIGDLVCGTYSNGSDERIYAEQWFDRCDFSSYGTFLAYLVNDVIYDYFTDLQNTVTKCGKELAKLDISDFDSSDGYEEEKYYLQRCLQDAEDEIQEMFDDYCSCNKNHKTYEQEAEGVFKFRESLKKALAHKKGRSGF